MKISQLVLSAAALGVASLSGVNAFFRMPCSQPVVVERADPIVNPGGVSGHLHTIMGGNAFNFTQTYDTARTSTCSSCKAKKDASNYWIPHLFYQAQNGSFHPVTQNGGATVYYLQRYSSNSNTLTPFPPGFRMLAGDPSLRSYNASSLAQQAVSWVCLDYSTTSPQTPQIPNTNCPDGLRSQVFFPSCWDGVNVDTPNHKDHVAYPSNMDSGDCPASHPVRLVSIFYEVIWNVNDFANMWWHSDGSHPFVLSMGDPTGYGHHGDFLNGWEQQALSTAINKCTQNSGVIEDCAADLELWDDAAMNDCRNPPQVDEITTGWLETLPGCNAVQNGPGKATSTSACGKSVPPILSKDQVGFIKQDIPLWDGVGCAQDNLNARLLPKKFSDPAQTIEKCMNTCLTNGYTYAGLEWGIECWCGNSFDSSKATLEGSCVQPCAGDQTEMCGNAGVLSVYHYNPNKISTPTTTTRVIGTTNAQSSPTPTTTTINGVTMTMVTTTTTTQHPQNTAQTTVPINVAQTPSTTATTTRATTTTTTPSQGSSSGSGSGSGSHSSPGHAAPQGWKYRGCYVDILQPHRSLPGAGMYYSLPMTPQVCVNHCASRGYGIAATEYGGECYCDNAFSGPATLRPDNECNMKCKGDNSVMCGGPARMSVYTVDSRSLKREVDDSPLKREVDSGEFGELVEKDQEIGISNATKRENDGHVVRSPSAGYGAYYLHHRKAFQAAQRRRSLH